MPMQLTEACMSTEFINLHPSWADGVGEEGKEEGSNMRPSFVSV